MRKLLLIVIVTLSILSCKKGTEPEEVKDEWVLVDSLFTDYNDWLFDDFEIGQGAGFRYNTYSFDDFDFFINDTTIIDTIINNFMGFDMINLTGKLTRERLSRGINEGKFFQKYPLKDYSVFAFTTWVGGYYTPKLVSYFVYKNNYKKEIEIRIEGKFPKVMNLGSTYEYKVLLVKKSDINDYKVKVVNNIVRSK
jgi:hypothetical protein